MWGLWDWLVLRTIRLCVDSLICSKFEGRKILQIVCRCSTMVAQIAEGYAARDDEEGAVEACR